MSFFSTYLEFNCPCLLKKLNARSRQFYDVLTRTILNLIWKSILLLVEWLFLALNVSYTLVGQMVSRQFTRGVVI